MIRQTLWIILGALIALIGVDLAMRVLPVTTTRASGYYVDPLVRSQPPGHHFTISFGWALRNAYEFESNNYGFLAHRDFKRDPHAVAVIGDSFIEAAMLRPEDRFAGQLEKVLHNRPVYTLGASGSSLLDYGERMRFAATKLGVRDFVVLLERNDIAQSYCKSGHVDAVCLDRKTGALTIDKKPEAGLAKRILRHSALAQYLFQNLEINLESLLSSAHRKRKVTAAGASAATDRNDVSFEQVDQVMNTFFARAAPYRKGRLIMVFDCDRRGLPTAKPEPNPARAYAMAVARKNGAIVVDTWPSFLTHYATTGLALEVSPQDSHWNKLANGLAAKAVRDRITGEPDLRAGAFRLNGDRRPPM